MSDHHHHHHHHHQQQQQEHQRHIAVIGSGIVGRSWAVVFARAGFPVKLYDVLQKQLDDALLDIKNAKLPTLEEHKMLNNRSCDEVAQYISTVTDIKDAIRNAIHVQTCVPEVLSVKQELFTMLDAVLTEVQNDDASIASSTSNISPSLFTEHMHHRARCLVCHPINPPFAIPLVEIVRAPWTNDQVVQRVRALMKQVGQAPIVLHKEVDGFVANRLQYALLAEAYRLVEDGIADAEDVDTAISSGLGLRWSFMGPFQTIDLNAPQGVEDYCQRYSSAILRVVKTQDNQREWHSETIAKINQAMRQRIPTEQLPARTEWRNDRLMKLAVHKREMEEREKQQQQQQQKENDKQ